MMILIICAVVLLFVGAPIAVAIAGSTTVAIGTSGIFGLEVVPQQMFIALNSFPLMAIPFFILAGHLMQVGGISERLIDFGSALIGHLTGGLAMAAVLTSMFFAAISGSGAATVAAIGSILIPAMLAHGYGRGFTAANQAVSGALGVIIPPSIPLILFAVAANESAGDMFLAGILPGIIVTMSLLLMAYFYSRKRGYKGVQKATGKELLIAFRRSILALLMPVIVLGGIYGGIFTPTEAAVVAVLYALIVGFVYKRFTLKKLADAFADSSVTSAIVMIVIAAAGLFAFYINVLGFPDQILAFMESINLGVVGFLILANLLLLIAGMFIEAAAAILIFVPILLPMAVGLGIDPVHFGMIMVVNLSVGLVTPPVGLNLFVASDLAKMSLSALSKAVIPFILVLLISIAIVSGVPQLSLWLPNLISGG
ncbi:TRAP transporter large permease [Brevibacterium yomogidense]|uniref:TRAP-type C4-dicarboxylate transport system, large permease component n=1 Tax=Brevibacterium yomogidense TaxID=946573 RepID=A0A1X6XIT2_9MICO|nr:TRAP transporter large permease [Brevibacterium yomogidense]SLM99191.1 TRAP-type C4-dicarboxylate transport system, large permease component [Brevibacterium yomogidense]